MKRTRQFSIWIIALLAMTVTNYAWAADTQKPTTGNITHINFTATTIEAKWTRGTDDVTMQSKLRYYVLWRKKSDNSSSWSFSHTSNFPVDITSYTITGLEPDTEYIVDVAVRDEADNTAFYGKKTVKTEDDTEHPVAGTLTVGTVTANSIALSWTKGSDNITPQNKLRYKVWWKNVSSGNTGSSSMMTDITSYTFSGLYPNTEYEISMMVYDQVGNGSLYNRKTVKTKAEADTQAPTAGTFTVGTVTANSIALSWTKGTDNVTPENKLMYVVGWTDTPSGEWDWKFSHERPFPIDMTSYTITGLKPDTEYRVDVTVYDEAYNRR